MMMMRNSNKKLSNSRDIYKNVFFLSNYFHHVLLTASVSLWVCIMPSKLIHWQKVIKCIPFEADFDLNQQ